jgi:hypothetical protein
MTDSAGVTAVLQWITAFLDAHTSTCGDAFHAPVDIRTEPNNTGLVLSCTCGAESRMPLYPGETDHLWQAIRDRSIIRRGG